jgi:uncharacterized membrane protein
MAEVKHSIKVEQPVDTVYNQWTQFEDFPRFMEGIERVEQKGDYDLFFKGKIAGVERNWNARIITQERDKRISWQSTEGAKNNGTVLFDSLGPNETEVTLKLEYEPDDWKEKVGDAMGVFDARVKGDLKNFKDYIEQRGQETGAYRGEKRSGKETPMR